MSHVTLSKARIDNTETDLKAVELACQQLGLVFQRGATQYRWFGAWADDYNARDAAHRQGVAVEDYGKCDHVIRLPWTPHQEEVYARDPEQRPYEIGLVKTKDGTFALAMDHWSCGEGVAALLAKVGGKECGGLMKVVAQNKVVLQVASQKGHYIKRIDDLGNGKTKIVVGVKQGDAV